MRILKSTYNVIPTWLFTFAFPDQGDSRPKPHHQHNNKEKITFCLPSSLSKKMFVNFWWNVEDKTLSSTFSKIGVRFDCGNNRCGCEERGEFLWWQVSVTECSKNAEQSSSFLPWFNYTEWDLCTHSAMVGMEMTGGGTLGTVWLKLFTCRWRL